MTTNVLKHDGPRAVGTVLDHKGMAYAGLIHREVFAGLVKILGIPCITASAPVLGRDGEVVGCTTWGIAWIRCLR